MTTENQDLALNFLKSVQDGDLEGAFSYTTEDITFRPIGTHPEMGRAFTGKDDILNNCWLAVFEHISPEGVPMTIENIASGENTAFIEFSGKAKGRSGMPYNNEYVHVYQIRGDKICSITEYLDTALFNKLLEQ